MKSIQLSKDPSTFTILIEDSAALLGILIAAVGLFLGHQFKNPYFDGAGSVAIGLLLSLVAIVLARESKGLLIGEGASPETIERIRKITETHPAVELTGEILSMYLGADNLFLTMELKFKSTMSALQIVVAIGEIESIIQSQFPNVKKISIEAASFRRSAKLQSA